MTTAIAYTSGKPHIGNTYEIILADAIARYKRAEGYDAYFQTGTDEHGQKIQEKAEAAGISPKEYKDRQWQDRIVAYAAIFRISMKCQDIEQGKRQAYIKLAEHGICPVKHWACLFQIQLTDHQIE